MKNTLMIAIVVSIISIFGIGAYVLSQKPEVESSMVKKDETVIQQDDKMPAVDISTSRYIEYSKANLDNTANTRRVLFFYANWCPVCKPANEDFETNPGKIPSDVTVIRVNYNDTDTDQEEKDLAQKYAVTYQHTFVQIDSTGGQVTIWNGGGMDELLSNLK